FRRKLHGTGAQYNMKVVIRGERGVGKSTLWRRLQGLPYEEKYTPTPEIQTTTINNWVYRGSRDVVKVEVWDVVDKGLAQGGKGRVPEGEDLEDVVAGLPPDHGSAGGGGRSLAVLDAGVVNVYQGASAIIFMVDPYRPETLDKAKKGLAEAPVDLPTVVLLNFRDKLEEDAVAKASQKSGISTTPASAAAAAVASTQSPTASAAEAAADPPPGDGDASATVGASSGTESAATAAAAGASEGFDSGSRAVDGGRGKGGAWDHVVTLETARLMMDRVKESDEAAGRGAGRRVSLFDCSMKNCFGLRVLYTYLNVPFLELKRKALLQQAQMASERLEKEYQELAGFIGGHSYGNYMQHLRASDVDPTAGRSAPAAPPGRPSIASMPAAGEAASLERRGSIDSHGGGGSRDSGGGGGRKEKKSKHHKDKDKSKKKDKHRHKSSKSKKDGREEAAPEYGGRVTDAKNFAPVTKKTATDELADFFGESSEGDSDEGLRERRKVVKAINPSALANAAAARADDATDSDEMPAPRTSRLKRVTAPTKPIARPPSTTQPQQSSIGAAASSRHQQPSLDDTKTSSVANVTGDVKGKEDVEEEPSAVRDTENFAAEEMGVRGEARTADEEEKGDGAEGEEGAAAHGEGTEPVAAGKESGDEADGVSEGRVLSEADTAAAAAAAAAAAVVADPSITPESSSKAGDGTAEGGGGEKAGNQAVQAEEEHSQAAGEGHQSADGQDHDEGREGSSRGREQAAGAVRKEEWQAEAETAAEQNDATLTTVSDSPAAKASPVAGKDPPPAHLSRDTSDTEAKENPQEADVDGTAGDDTVVRVDQATDAGDDGDNYTGGPPQADTASEEVGPSAEVDDGIVSHSADAAVDQEAVTVQRNAEDEHPANGDCGPEQEVAAVPEIERAEADDAVVDEYDETGARGQELSGGESGGELGADVGREAAVVRKMEGGGIDDEPGAEAPEQGVTINDDYVGEESLGGPVAEDFFAEDISSGEDELYPGTATAAGGEVVSAERGVADGGDGAPAGDHPASPRIIATSLEAAPRGGDEKRLGFPPSPVATQRKEAAAVGPVAASGDVELSEAAKAAVEAALASAQSLSARRSSRSSRKADDSSSKSRKKKKSHKERRRKDGGSKSGGEDGARVVGGRRSGSVGPSDVDSGEKLSSSKRHHRKPAV
ncbi:unnamed protein product, partial [Ectocarpus sp. 4 AP-2014]